MISGFVTIGAVHSSPFSLPPEGKLVEGNHCIGRYTGSWALQFDEASVETRQILLPHRDKQVTALWDSDSLPQVDYLTSRLETLDAAYEGETQLFKYNELLRDLVASWGPTTSPVAGVLNTVSTHSSFSLLSVSQPMDLVGVFDPQLGSAYLAWSTCPPGFDLAASIRRTYPLKYLFYRFPKVCNRAIFIPTQAICAHWWKYMKGENPLFAFNALELKLFK